MDVNKTNQSINHQGHPHQEGAQGNIPPLQEGDGQRNSDNHGQAMSNMMQESEEQKAGQAHGQKDERDVQQDERLP